MSSFFQRDPTNLAMKRSKREAERVDLTTYFFRCAVSVATYPVEYSKTLMQLGYEPYAPTRTVSFFGRPCLAFPNILQYIKYIKQVDGFFGCYRGLVAYLLHKSILIYTCDSIAEYWDTKPSVEEDQRLQIEKMLERTQEGYPSDGDTSPAETEDEVYTFQLFLKDLARDLVCRLGGLTVSYPFLVIAVQTMSAFVGRERVMCHGVSMAMNHIWKVQGPLGFFNGLIPRLMGEAVGIVAIGLASYLIRTRIASEEVRTCSKISMNVLTGALVYPFTVVSTTMIVNGSGLKIGQPPFSPTYVHWLDCWAHLQETNILRRGSSLVFRYYTGPITVNEGLLSPIGVHFGPDHTKTPMLKKF